VQRPEKMPFQRTSGINSFSDYLALSFPVRPCTAIWKYQIYVDCPGNSIDGKINRQMYEKKRNHDCIRIPPKFTSTAQAIVEK